MAMYKAKEALHKLSDTHLTMAHDAEDIRGRQVLDTAGEYVGEIDDLGVHFLAAEQRARLVGAPVGQSRLAAAGRKTGRITRSLTSSEGLRKAVSNAGRARRTGTKQRREESNTGRNG